MKFYLPVQQWLYLDETWDLIIRNQSGNTNFVNRVIKPSGIPHSAGVSGTNVSFPPYTRFMITEISIHPRVPEDFQFKLRMSYVNGKGETKEATCWIRKGDLESASFVEDKEGVMLKEHENRLDDRFANIEI